MIEQVTLLEKEDYSELDFEFSENEIQSVCPECAIESGCSKHGRSTYHIDCRECRLVRAGSETCRDHDPGFDNPGEDISYCPTCQRLCVEHRVYGILGRRININYGRVFYKTYQELSLKRKEVTNISLAETIDRKVRSYIESVKTADVDARSAIIHTLLHWTENPLSDEEQEEVWESIIERLHRGIDILPYEREFVKYAESYFLDFRYPGDVFSSEMTEFIFNSELSEFMADNVALAYARGFPNSRMFFAYSFGMNPFAAMIGVEAYLEALVLLLRFENELRPPDFARGLVAYYLARRLEDPEKIAEAKAELLFGTNKKGHGPLYRKALYQYSSLPSVDCEMAADSYCDAFLQTLDDLPVEALLSPGRAVGYALKAAAWAGNKKIPETVTLTLPNQEPAYIEVENAQEENLDRLVKYKSLPGYELALRYYGDGTSLAELGKELGISKQAVQKRIRKFLDKSRSLQDN